MSPSYRLSRESPLSPEDLAALRESLQEQRLFREEQLRQLAVSPSRTGDPGRRPAAAPAGGRVGLASSARMVLADVEAALERMAEGRYGRCHLCRRPVDRERLVIVPQARYCARCQQVREAGR
ncbi:TraR/DksA family transcriptional regulator [Streptomyces sp. enrichment culture]|uniref:TraR/DksA family transcriptional regulator n=1 Tax=Streptomyces sp. enrichment culture TaxID=1795815 RepID=UPI003F5799F9